MRRLIGLLVAAVVVAGCGDMSHDELGRRVDSLTAITGEARLLARDVVHDRTKATYVRVHGSELADDAQHEAEKVADARIAAGSKGHAAETVDLAERLSDAIGTLVVHPGDEQKASGVGRELVSIQDDLDRLGGQT
jgi:hypothetical protein